MSDNLAASSVIDQDEWQPAILPGEQVKVTCFDGPLAGCWGISHGAPSFLLCDWDGVTFFEYERYDEKYDTSGNVDHVEYVYRRTVSKP